MTSEDVKQLDTSIYAVCIHIQYPVFMNTVDVGEHTTRRGKILEAAVQVIAVDGADAPFSAIAQVAGVSPALITYHFQSRKELLLAVASAVNADMDRAFNDDAEQERDPGMSLRLLVHGFLDYAVERPHAFRTLQALVHALTEDERANSPAIAANRGIDSVSHMIAAAQSAGDIPPGPVRPLAVAVLGALGSLAFDIATGRGDIQQTRSAGITHTIRMLGLSS